MRVLFVVSAWAGHYFPLVPLGWALRGAGHDVRVLCTAGDTERLMHSGLHPVPALPGGDMLRVNRLTNVLSAYTGNWPYPEPPPHPDTGEPFDQATFDLDAAVEDTQQSLGDRSRRSCEAAESYARSWRPDLVVHDLLSCEGPLAAHAVGVPSVLHLWGPTGTEDTLESVGGFGSDTSFAEMTAWSAFVPLIGEEATAVIQKQLGYVLDPCPPQLSPNTKGTRVPIRYVPYNGAGVVPHELLEPSDRKRVCVVWGRSATDAFGQTVNKIREATAAAVELGAEVFLLASAQDVGTEEFSGPVHRLIEMPLQLVLPQCDAVVHYVGAGVLMTSTALGVPQLMLPLCAEAEDRLASRVVEAGCGLSVRNYEADTPSIRDGLARLLSEPAFAASARRMAANIAAMPAPNTVVPLLEDLVTG